MLRRGNSNKCRKRSRSRRSVRKMTCDGWHARVTTRQPAQPAWGLKEAHNTGDRWQAGWLNGEGRSREVDISDLSIFKMCFLTGWTRKAGNGSRSRRISTTKSINRQMSVWTMTRKGDHGGRGGGMRIRLPITTKAKVTNFTPAQQSKFSVVQDLHISP